MSQAVYLLIIAEKNPFYQKILKIIYFDWKQGHVQGINCNIQCNVTEHYITVPGGFQ